MASVFGSFGSSRRGGAPAPDPGDRRPRIDGYPVDRIPEVIAEARRGSRRRITTIGEDVLARPCREVTAFGTTGLKALVDDLYAVSYTHLDVYKRQVLGHDPDRPTIAAVIGDSTFAHSGLTGLLNACWNKRDVLYIVLDNGTTAMTGTQPNPMSGERMGREDAWALSYPYLAKAFGIPDENFAQVDAHDRAAVTAAIDDLADRRGVRLLAVVGLCVIEAKELGKIGKLDDKREDRKVIHLPLVEVGGPGRG